MSRFTRLLNVFRSKSLERDFDEEIQFHLDERTRQRIVQGIDPDDAAAAAREQFGSIERAQAGMRAVHVIRWTAAAITGCAVVVMQLMAAVEHWAGGGARVYDLTDDITTPVPIVGPKPHYNDAARHAKIQGTVRVRCVVRPSGHCSDTTVIRSLDRTFGLDDEALRAMRNWRFRPALLNGKPVAARISVDMTFTLR